MLTVTWQMVWLFSIEWTVGVWVCIELIVTCVAGTDFASIVALSVISVKVSNKAVFRSAWLWAVICAFGTVSGNFSIILKIRGLSTISCLTDIIGVYAVGDKAIAIVTWTTRLVNVSAILLATCINCSVTRLCCICCSCSGIHSCCVTGLSSIFCGCICSCISLSIYNLNCYHQDS